GAFAALAMRQPHHSLALLPGRFLLAGDRSTRPATGPRVGVRALPPAGEVASMAHPAVRADLDQPLDVEPDALAQVPFDAPFRVDHTRDAQDLVFREVFHAHARFDVRLRDDRQRA